MVVLPDLPLDLLWLLLYAASPEAVAILSQTCRALHASATSRALWLSFANALRMRHPYLGTPIIKATQTGRQYFDCISGHIRRGAYFARMVRSDGILTLQLRGAFGDNGNLRRAQVRVGLLARRWNPSAVCFEFRMLQGTWTRPLAITILEQLLLDMPQTSPYLPAQGWDLTLFDEETLHPPTGAVVVINQGVFLDMARPADTYAMRHAIRMFVNANDGNYTAGISYVVGDETVGPITRWMLYLRPDGPTVEHLQQLWIDLTAPWGWQLTLLDRRL